MNNIIEEPNAYRCWNKTNEIIKRYDKSTTCEIRLVKPNEWGMRNEIRRNRPARRTTPTTAMSLAKICLGNGIFSVFLFRLDYRIDKKLLSDYKYPLSLAGEFRNWMGNNEKNVRAAWKTQMNKTIIILHLSVLPTPREQSAFSEQFVITIRPFGVSELSFSRVFIWNNDTMQKRLKPKGH